MEREARLRYAKSSDLDRITEIGLAASATDPLDQYRYPFSNLYPQDHEKLLRTRFRRYLWDAEVGACKVMVAEFFQEGTKGAYVVGYAIWETNERYAQSDKPQKGDGNRPTNDLESLRSVHTERANNFKTDVVAAQRRWYDSKYGGNRWYLRLVATHPDYRGLKIAEHLLTWGYNQAGDVSLIVIGFVLNPKNLPFFLRLGCEISDHTVSKLDGEDESVDIYGVVKMPPSRNPKSLL